MPARHAWPATAATAGANAVPLNRTTSATFAFAFVTSKLVANAGRTKRCKGVLACSNPSPCPPPPSTIWGEHRRDGGPDPARGRRGADAVSPEGSRLFSGHHALLFAECGAGAHQLPQCPVAAACPLRHGHSLRRNRAWLATASGAVSVAAGATPSCRLGLDYRPYAAVGYRALPGHSWGFPSPP